MDYLQEFAQWWNSVPSLTQWLTYLVGIPVGLPIIGYLASSGYFDYQQEWARARTANDRVMVYAKRLLACYTVGVVAIVTFILLFVPAFLLMKFGVPLGWAMPVGVVFGIIGVIGVVIWQAEVAREKNNENNS